MGRGCVVVDIVAVKPYPARCSNTNSFFADLVRWRAEA
jgi:hypothetical protein